jgi:hypothetical protein
MTETWRAGKSIGDCQEPARQLVGFDGPRLWRPAMRQIVVEAETPDDPRTLFRLRVDQTLIAEGLTSAQAQIAVGEILEEITTMEQPKFPDPRPYINEPPSGIDSFWRLVLAWGFVGIPLLWGIYSTLVSATKLFE